MTERALLFTDVVDSTRVVQRLGDMAAAAMWAEHDRLARVLLAEYGGIEIDRSDGFFLLFDEVGRAAQFAVGYHAAIAPLGIAARVGIHNGTVALRQNPPEAVAHGAKAVEVEGLAKPLTARVMSLAAGGQTLLSGAAAEALQPLLEIDRKLRSHGHYRLKGIEDPLLLFELGDERCAFVPPADADKAYRVVAEGELWKPVREIRHNLIPERDAFVGRTMELRRLAEMLDGGARLVSVLGVGGTGKTRLVRRYARAWLGDWPGGVYFCDLSEARSLEGICYAVSTALAVPLGKDDPVVQVGLVLAARGCCLVLLDNFEQVVEHAAATLGSWLDRAGNAAFVVTSRERLQVVGEHPLQVEPLPLDNEALKLFDIRARAQRPDFELVGGAANDVRQIVELLDGLPLAIELAAARVRVLSPAQIVLRLKDRFALLAGARGAAARQATLRAAIDWSWDLLTRWEQAALAQCSVFNGGFTMEAAEAVLDLSPWPHAGLAVDVVQSLVDKSLVRAWIAKSGARLDLAEPYFGMYVSIHAYAADRLAGILPDGRCAAETRHGNFYARLGTDEALAALSRHGCVQRRHRLTAEIDNLVSACVRAAAAGQPCIATATFRAASEVFELRGPARTALQLAERVLAMDTLDERQRVAALLFQGRAYTTAGTRAQAERSLDLALASARGLDEPALRAHALYLLGLLHRTTGLVDAAEQELRSAADLYRTIGDAGREAVCRGNLALLCGQTGRLDEAFELHRDALRVHRETGNRISEAAVLANLAMLEHEQGRLGESLENIEQALAIQREVGNWHAEAIALGNLGNIHFDRGDIERAIGCKEAALVIHRDIGYRFGEAAMLGHIGQMQQNLGRPELAVSMCRNALAIAVDIGNRTLQGGLLGAISELLAEEGDDDEALAHCEAGLEALREVDDRRSEAICLGLLGHVLGRKGRGAEAREAFARGEATLRELGDVVSLGILLCRRGALDAASSQPAAARAALAEADATAEAIGATPASDLRRAIGTLRLAIGGAESSRR